MGQILNPSKSKQPSPIKDAIRLRMISKFTEAINLLLEYLPTLDSNNRFELIGSFNELSHCSIRTGKFKEAHKYAEKALALSEQYPKILEEKAKALVNIGILWRYDGDYNLSESVLQKSLSIFKDLNDKIGISEALINLGNVYLVMGILSKAEDMYEQVKQIGEHLQDNMMIARSYNNLGEVCRVRGDLFKASEYYEISLKLNNELGDPRSISISYINLGHVYRESGKWQQAENAYQRCLSLSQGVWVASGISEARYCLFDLYCLTDKLDLAQEELQRLDELNQSSNLKDVEIRLYLAQSNIRLKRLDTGSALEWAKKAKVEAENIKHGELLVATLLLLVKIHLQLFLLSSKPSHKQEIHRFLIELETISKNHRLHKVYIESLLIKALEKRANFELTDAKFVFEVVDLLASERGLLTLSLRAKTELKQLQEQSEVLQRFIQLEPKAYEQSQLKVLLSYLEDAQKLATDKLTKNSE